MPSQPGAAPRAFGIQGLALRHMRSPPSLAAPPLPALLDVLVVLRAARVGQAGDRVGWGAPFAHVCQTLTSSTEPCLCCSGFTIDGRNVPLYPAETWVTTKCHQPSAQPACLPEHEHGLGGWAAPAAAYHLLKAREGGGLGVAPHRPPGDQQAGQALQHEEAAAGQVVRPAGGGG